MENNYTVETTETRRLTLPELTPCILLIFVIFVASAIFLILYNLHSNTLIFTDASNEKIEVNKKFDALQRMMRIDQACYDRKNNIFLVHFQPLSNEEMEILDVDSDDLANQWRFERADRIQMIELDNKSVSLYGDSDKIFNEEIWPDIDKLPCKKF